MPVTYVLVKRKSPMNPDADARWYAETSKCRVCSFDEVTTDATQSSSATRGDVQLVLDAAINSMIKHLANGEIVQLGDFGNFRMKVRNTKKVWNEESGAWETAAPKNRSDFNASRNIAKSSIVFTPGKGMKSMLASARYQLIDGGTKE